MRRPLAALVLVAAASSFVPAANAATLELSFNSAPTSIKYDFNALATDYGSLPGLLAVSYHYLDRDGQEGNFFFSDVFSGQVAAFAGTMKDSIGAITFKPYSGYQVTLDSFSLVGYNGTPRTVSYSVDDSATSGVDFSKNSVLIGADTNFSLNVVPHLTSADGIVLSFGPDAFNVGISNIKFSVLPVSTVPEPETISMLLAGLGLMGVVARRRAKQRKS
jgi:hypothetical protein